jgi:arabinan endo-1,5-alpha-L-arabinosidase
MTGAMTGKWSYDSSKKQLTLGDVVVCVEREADWEASPRVATIVYAGIGKDASDTAKTITYWGKKVE